MKDQVHFVPADDRRRVQSGLDLSCTLQWNLQYNLYRKNSDIHLENGETYSWGSSQVGQLGHGSVPGIQSLPKLIEKLHGKNIRSISCGSSHTVALNDAGKVTCFGNSVNGQCGFINTSNAFSVPRTLKSLYKHTIVFVACGTNHTGLWAL
jgi:alpha-tubulin suppressor-like RCC1 family protein